MRDKSRLLFIDYTKGFAILLMVLSHCIPGEGIIKIWIFAFHMPIFFIICGYLINHRQQVICNKESIIKRFKSLYKPYFILGSPLLFFYFALGVYTENLTNFNHKLIHFITLQGIDSLWFIPVYFCAELLYITFNHFKSYHLNTYLSFFLFVILLFTNESLWPSLFLKRVIVGYLFIAIGTYIHQYQLEHKLQTGIYISIFILFSCSTQIYGFSSMACMENVSLYFINATAISVSILGLFYKIEKSFYNFNWLYYFGKNSIIILCTNNLIIETIRLIDFKLFGNTLIVNGIRGG